MAEGKIALMGFDRFKIFPLTKNTSEGYKVGAGELIPWVQSMTKEADVAESPIYADDTLYMNVKNFNGMNVELTVAEMPLKKWADLGFGEYDDATDTLAWNPQGKNLEFGATFRCLQANGDYRMYRMYRFVVTGITEAETTTKGDTADIQPYTISGIFSPRSADAQIGAIHDGTDFEWLDTIPTVE